MLKYSCCLCGPSRRNWKSTVPQVRESGNYLLTGCQGSLSPLPQSQSWGWGQENGGWKTGFPAESQLVPQNTSAVSVPALSSSRCGGVSLGQQPPGQHVLRDTVLMGELGLPPYSTEYGLTWLRLTWVPDVLRAALLKSRERMTSFLVCKRVRYSLMYLNHNLVSKIIWAALKYLENMLLMYKHTHR